MLLAKLAILSDNERQRPRRATCPKCSVNPFRVTRLVGEHGVRPGRGGCEPIDYGTGAWSLVGADCRLPPADHVTPTFFNDSSNLEAETVREILVPENVSQHTPNVPKFRRLSIFCPSQCRSESRSSTRFPCEACVTGKGQRLSRDVAPTQPPVCLVPVKPLGLTPPRVRLAG
jgi:hypothetical protein